MSGRLLLWLKRVILVLLLLPPARQLRGRMFLWRRVRLMEMLRLEMISTVLSASSSSRGPIPVSDISSGPVAGCGTAMPPGSVDRLLVAHQFDAMRCGAVRCDVVR